MSITFNIPCDCAREVPACPICGANMHQACPRCGEEQAAVEEDADVVGLSTLSGNHMTLGPRVVKLLKKKGLDNVKVFMGGVMPPKDAVKLEEKHGVHKVYLPDTPMETIIEGIRSSVSGS